MFVSVFTTIVLFVRCRQHSRQQPNALLVVSDHKKLVSCGNTGITDAAVAWIPAAMLLIVEFAHRLHFFNTPNEATTATFPET